MGTITAEGLIALCYTVVMATPEEEVRSGSGLVEEICTMAGLLAPGESPWRTQGARCALFSHVWDMVMCLRTPAGRVDLPRHEEPIRQWFADHGDLRPAQ